MAEEPRQGEGRDEAATTVTGDPIAGPRGPIDLPAGGPTALDQSLWPAPPVVPEQYPARMARRRALQALAVQGAWAPDPLVTEPVLRRVEQQLAALLDANPSVATAVLPDTPPATGRRRLARHRAVLATTLVVTALVVSVLVAALGLHRGGSPAGGSSSAAPAPQRVVALVLARSGQVSGVSLLASGAGAPQQVLVPSRLVLDVPGAGRMPLGQALAVSPSAVAGALADALDIRVDATWVLDRSTLASLVDRVGGVVVDVDVDVPADVAADGKGPAPPAADAGGAVLANAGPRQRLSGSQAAAYAQLIVGSEPEALRLARQKLVLNALLGALPGDPAARRALLAAGPAAPWGAALDVVAATTGGLRSEASTGLLASTVLPVDDIDTGGDVPSYGLDVEAAAALVRSRLAGAVLTAPPGGRTRVLVQNGVGAPGLGEAARSRLVAAGLRYVGGGNVEGFGIPRSLVLLPDASPRSRARGNEVLRALGLSAEALRVSDAAPTVADLVVLLGGDFGAS